ncbi:MAG: FtsX-like permease family protein [Azospirillaceae bacterium]
MSMPAGWENEPGSRLARRGQDIPLGRRGADRFLPYVLGAITFLGALMLVVAIVAVESLRVWDTGLTGTLTVQVPSLEDTDRTAARVARAVRVLEEADGVVAVRALSAAESVALVEPWLGDAEILAELMLPILIDVELADDGGVDTIALAIALEEIDPGIQIDDHGDWVNRVLGLAQAIAGIALVSVGIVALALIAAIVFATRSGIAAHRHTISMLHLMGAPDGFVARQFQRHMALISLRGLVMGVVLALLALAGIAWAAADVPALVVSIDPLAWTNVVAVALIVPVGFVIALVAARVTVMRTLARMP